MSEFLFDELGYDIQKYLRIRKVLRFVELVGLLVVILVAAFMRPSISELIFSLLSVLIVLECFIAIQRWVTRSLIGKVLLFLNDELKEICEQFYESDNPVMIGYYQNVCNDLKEKITKVEDLKRLVVF